MWIRLYHFKRLVTLSSESSREEEEEIERIQQEEIELFDAYEPLRIPYECESCSFFTTDSVLAADHTAFHLDLATKDISRWEPSTLPIPMSVIVSNPYFSNWVRYMYHEMRIFKVTCDKYL